MKVNGNHIILAYADDIIILGDTRQDTVNNMSNLMKVCKHMGLLVKQKKTKYMYMYETLKTN